MQKSVNRTVDGAVAAGLPPPLQQGLEPLHQLFLVLFQWVGCFLFQQVIAGVEVGAQWEFAEGRWLWTRA